MERRINYMAIFLLLLYVVLSSMGLILFKMGTTANGFVLNLFGLNLHLSWQMIVGVLCYGFSFLLWLYIVGKNNLTYIYPVSIALINIFIVVGSLVLLHENITFMQGIGIVVVVLGVVLMKWGS